jgi:hypothetical protein
VHAAFLGKMRINTTRAAFLLLLAISLSVSACNSGGPACISYGAVSVCGPLLQFYRDHGEGAVLGYPLSPAVTDGTHVIQYFENAVLQQPVNSTRADSVQLRPLGMRFSQPAPSETPSGDPGCLYFDRHGQHVCGAFYEFFVRHGGEATFGQPISSIVLEGGIRTQHFENVKFQWMTDAGQPHVKLDRWGELACLQDGISCSDNRYAYARPEIKPTPADEAGQDVAAFVDAHGGVDAMGPALGPLVPAGDVAYQYYRNVCVLWSPNQDVSLAPLGRLGAPAVDPVPAPAPSDDLIYFAETGHSVILAFRDYFLANGGREVFGLPLTEFMEQDGLWLQWFENARFEWRPDLPNGQRVQLTNLGEINYERLRGALPQVDAPSAVDQAAAPSTPEAIILHILPENPVLVLGNLQRVELVAMDPAGQPLPGTDITLYVSTSTSQRVIVAPPTDINGGVWVELGVVEGACTEVVQLRAVAETAGAVAFSNSQFTLWCSPN